MRNDAQPHSGGIYRPRNPRLNPLYQCVRHWAMTSMQSPGADCPRCHQKRMLACGDWLEDNVLTPVPRRQNVFALPKLIRPLFRLRMHVICTGHGLYSYIYLSNIN